MTYATMISQQLKGFKDTDAVVNLLANYGLPTFVDFDAKKAFKVLQKDKKKDDVSIHYILLEKTGKAVVQPLLIIQLKEIFKQF